MRKNDLVRQILKSPLFRVENADQQQRTLDSIIATGETTREEVYQTLSEILNEEKGVNWKKKYKEEFSHVPALGIMKEKRPGTWEQEYWHTKALEMTLDNSFNNLVTKLDIHNISLHDRTNLCKELKEYWVGQSRSNIGVGGGLRINWKTRKIEKEEDRSYGGPRRDIFVVASPAGNLFLNPEDFGILRYPGLHFNAQNAEQRQYAKQHRRDYKIFVAKILPLKYRDFIKRQQAWNDWYWRFNIKNVTPEELVNILDKEGWCDDYEAPPYWSKFA